jgi:tRNA-dihydrouridine synthase B
LTIPVFGSGDCIEPEQIVERLRQGISGVFVGRGVLRNPWILAQARDLLTVGAARQVSLEDRGQFLLDYIELLQDERVHEPEGFRHVAPEQTPGIAPRHDRWVINKLRALCSWYTKGLEGGAQLRTAVNSAQSLAELTAIIEDFFLLAPARAE